MPCCGKSREAFRGTLAVAEPTAAPAIERQMSYRSTVEFEYVGGTRLMVVGPATGRTYHFASQGAREWVDVRDRPSVRAVPNLRELRS